MIGLVEKISGHPEAEKPAIQVQCAFALNRRNKEGDRARALALLEKVCSTCCMCTVEMLPLCLPLFLKRKRFENRTVTLADFTCMALTCI